MALLPKHTLGCLIGMGELRKEMLCKCLRLERPKFPSLFEPLHYKLVPSLCLVHRLHLAA